MSNGQDAVRLLDPTGDILLSNLSASGNLTDAVYILGLNTPIMGAVHWSSPGLPYVIDTLMGNHYGDALHIDPGNELRFGLNDGLVIAGELIAAGVPGQPITFTAQTKAPGQWRGIAVSGGTQPASVNLDFASVEYGGGDIQGADITVDDGVLSVPHSLIRRGRTS